MKKLIFLTLIVVFLPVATWAGVWQDPNTKVNYSYESYGSHYRSASVLGAYNDNPTSGSPDAKGDITILSSFTVNGVEYSVNYIGQKAFYKNTNITSITIPEGVTSIDQDAFYGCIRLSEIHIPTTLMDILGYSTFEGCNSLNAVHIKDVDAWYNNGIWYNSNPLKYAKHLYLNGEKVEHLVLKEIEPFQSCAFQGLKDLKSITFAEGVTKINLFSFSNCSNITSITLPSSLSVMAGWPAGLDNLTEIHISDLPSYCKIKREHTSSLHNWKLKLFLNGEEVKDLVIPEGVIIINTDAFRNFTGLTSVSIPNSVDTIGAGAFMNCSGIPSLTLGDDVTSIGDDAFFGCSGLTSINIPKSLTTIGNGAFAGCSGITSLTLGDGVTSIGNQAFQNCTHLTSINLPKSLTTIGNRAFSNCSSLASIDIPDGVMNIGESAFWRCYSLTSVNIPNGVTSIEYKTCI